jgi:hypothetical protein
LLSRAFHLDLGVGYDVGQEVLSQELLGVNIHEAQEDLLYFLSKGKLQCIPPH